MTEASLVLLETVGVDDGVLEWRSRDLVLLTTVS